MPVVVMGDDTCPVQWIGRYAVATLPECVDGSNADQVREQLLCAINQGAFVLIADLTATVSCDYPGSQALVRAYQRAVASGTELQLAVASDDTRDALRLSGLHRLVPVYTSVAEALLAGPAKAPGEPGTAGVIPASPGPGKPVSASAADRPGTAEEFLNGVVISIVHSTMGLQDAAVLPRDVLVQRVTEALRRLDGVVREIYDHVFAGQAGASQPALARWHPKEIYEQAAQDPERSALLNQRVVQTARALQRAAADSAALLERRAELVEEPRRIDYPTEIKRWRVFADQARELADRLEQRPQPDS